jgi:hypothetical protein
MNGDGVIDRADRLRNQVVSGKSSGYLARSRTSVSARPSRNGCTLFGSIPGPGESRQGES